MGKQYANECAVHVTYDRVVRNDPDQLAVLLEFDGHNVWIPKSQINLYSGTLEQGEEGGWIEIPEWLAISKEIDAYAEYLD